MPSEPSAAARTRLSRGGQLARLSAAAGKSLIAARRAQRRGDGDAADSWHDEIAQVVLETLGSMKGAAMKAGQLLSYLDLPMDEETAHRYHRVLAKLQDSAIESDPDTIAEVLHADYGAPADQVFAEWESAPFAVASIGQVHRARLHDGSRVAVKVQHPGVAEATLADLANLEFLIPLLRVLNPRLAPGPLLDEVRARLDEELDYETEARYHQAFAERYAGHPFVRIPQVHRDWCRPRVLVTDLVDEASFGEVAVTADQATRDRYGEIIFRFVFGSLYRFRIFNADPHPGNYLFPGDGSVVFIDFGSCKTFSTADRARLHAVHSAVRNDDDRGLRAAMREAGLLDEHFDGDFAVVRQWFQLMHRPMGSDVPFTYTAAYAREVTAASMDPDEGYVETLRRLQMPASYLMLNRIQFGLTSLLARMQPTACWGDILYELSEDAAPATALGRAEREFMHASPHRA
ncbi:MAG: AarF/ABC1/UbiB kinase family protein [Actinobacteria bacterium]|nr:AarF/ABC1/UbiB kinase family protein [Actinomycetota bacterium]